MKDESKAKAQLIAELQAARENAERLARESEQRNTELAIINSVQAGLASKMDMQAIYDLVGDKIRDIFDAQVVDIGLYDRSENLVHFPYTIERGERFPDEPMALIGYRKHVIETRQNLLINEKAAEAAAQYGNPTVLQGEPAKSSVFVPMLVGGEAKGVISLQNLDREHAFRDADVRLLQTLANSLGVALENARLFDETQRLFQAEQQRSAELAIVNRISQALASELEPDALIQLVGERLRETFNADIVYVALLDRATNTIHFPYGFGTEDFASFPFGEGLTSKIIESGQPLLINREFEARGEEIGATRIGTRAKSYLGVPIFVGKQAIGVVSMMSIDKYQADFYSLEHVRLAQAFAAQAATALENARPTRKRRPSARHRAFT